MRYINVKHNDTIRNPKKRGDELLDGKHAVLLDGMAQIAAESNCGQCSRESLPGDCTSWQCSLHMKKVARTCLMVSGRAK